MTGRGSTPNIRVQGHLSVEEPLPIMPPRGWLLADKGTVYETDKLLVVQRYELVGAPVESAGLFGKEPVAASPPRTAVRSDVRVSHARRSDGVKLQYAMKLAPMHVVLCYGVIPAVAIANKFKPSCTQPAVTRKLGDYLMNNLDFREQLGVFTQFPEQQLAIWIIGSESTSAPARQ